jgi:hypothetical protein
MTKQAEPITSTFFSKEKTDLLEEAISKDDVKTREGGGKTKLSYLPAYHLIAEANRIFGHGQWSTEIMHIHQIDKTIYEKPPYKAGDDPKEMVSVSFLCHLKLTVRNGGGLENSHEDSGFGNGVGANTAFGISSCIELASKEAVTDSLKRCLRYYGSKFGLSLYDKDDVPQELSEIEAARLVTDVQLQSLRDLYTDRGVNDEWVLTALKAEHYPHPTLELMRNDWFEMAFDITHKYKFEELERDAYEADIEKAMTLLSESANMNMLKAVFAEVWKKTARFDDKDRQVKATEIYNELKAKFEETK